MDRIRIPESSNVLKGFFFKNLTYVLKNNVPRIELDFKRYYIQGESEKTEFSDFLIQPVGIWKKQL